MHTLRLDARIPGDIARAAKILRGGGTVAFPTETVYGLGANALEAVAVERIFAAKQRPHWDPLIVHVSDRAMLERVVVEVPRVAEQLMARYWPGPLTLLLRRTTAVPEIVTAGRPLVGVRMPAHAVALELIRQAGVPVAAPSANTFGHTSPTTAAHVLADLDGRIDAVLDGGPTEVGVESTVVGFEPGGVIVYRPGGLELDSDFSSDPPMDLGWVRAYEIPVTRGKPESLPSPGVGIRHYAPQAKVVLVERPAVHVEESLVGAIDEATTEHSRVGVMLPDDWNASAADLLYPWGAWWDHALLARRLFSGMRDLEEQGATVIVCPVPQGEGIAEAIRDRLRKASW